MIIKILCTRDKTEGTIQEHFIKYDYIIFPLIVYLRESLN